MGEHMPFGIVVWDDAWGDGSDTTTVADAEEKHRPTVMQTVGWILKDDDRGVSLFNERCLDKGEEVYRSRTFIPRSLIKSVTPMTLTKPRKVIKSKPKPPAEVA